MPYSEFMVTPMRRDLTRLGFRELRTAEEVDEALGERRGTVLLAVNSICGCAAGRMRPAVALAMQHGVGPDVLTTVFAGQDVEATARARDYITDYSPSSPSVALFKDGAVVFMLERRDIENRAAEEIAADLEAAFAAHCVPREAAP
ncbi:MAG: BrxA/BrxB family bacilliredoxin [Gemmatimonadetes bacterium]|nr:BrxA/BrxB family bacilliredoxin [Gemmatimonadota bacterium]